MQETTHLHEEDLNTKITPEVEGERQQFITFTVNDQEYGVDIMSVREIKGWVETTHLPNTPNYMRGVINLRGAVVPILDLRNRFGMGRTNATKNHVVMIVNVESRIMGILVDAVSDILTISSGEIRPVPSIDQDNKSVLKGLVNLSDRMVALLVLEKLFDAHIEISEETIQATLQTEDC